MFFFPKINISIVFIKCLIQLSFLLKDYFAEITLMDSSAEMIKVCKEKIAFFETKHIKPLLFNLENSDFNRQFDMIYNQMVMHHVIDVNVLFRKFYSMLNSGGYLAIADLYAEDGSFHGPEAKNVHYGFDPVEMSKNLATIGFVNISYKNCFVVKRSNGSEYPLFLLTAQK
jgi:tRNA (cmo5U34)-methyltransferase